MDKKYEIGLGISEKDYRDLPYPSYSLLSDIAKNGVEVIDGKKNLDIQELDGIMVGKLVDNLYIENKFPDNLHVINKKPTGKAKEILKAIAKYRGKMPNKDIFHIENESILNNICSKIEYYKSSKKYDFNEKHPDLIKKRLDGLKNYKEYYELIISLDNIDDAFIITKYLYDASIKMVDKLKKFMNLNNSNGVFVIPQVQIVGSVLGIDLKGMLDFIVVDTINKTITPYDLKTGSYSNKDFIEKGFFGWNYYLQSSLYFVILRQEMSKHPIYKDYFLDDFHFIFCGREEKIPKKYSVPKHEINNYSRSFQLAGYGEKKGLFDTIEMYKKHKGIF